MIKVGDAALTDLAMMAPRRSPDEASDAVGFAVGPAVAVVIDVAKIVERLAGAEAIFDDDRDGQTSFGGPRDDPGVAPMDAFQAQQCQKSAASDEVEAGDATFSEPGREPRRDPQNDHDHAENHDDAHGRLPSPHFRRFRQRWQRIRNEP